MTTKRIAVALLLIVAATADTMQSPAAVHTLEASSGVLRTVQFPGNYIASVLLDPARPARVLAAVSAVDKNFTPMSTPGLYLSDDHGATFAPLTRDLLPSTQAWQLALDPGHDGAYYVSLYSAAGGLLRVTPP